MPPSPRIHDAAVVGGGPAGCHAARRLAAAGLDVLLVEAEELPRWKPCAGGISLKTGPYVPAELRDRLERTIYGAHLSFGDGLDVHVRADRPVGWMVHRESFDQAHFELARAQAGVTARTGWRVTGVREEDDRVVLAGRTAHGAVSAAARAVVGADGVKSVVARSVRPHAERRLAVAFEGEASFPRPELSDDLLFDFRGFAGGYGWIFPKRDHYSVGGYVYQGKARGLRRDYEAFCAGSRWLADCSTFRTKGHGVPAGGTRDRLASRRIVLAGDAADTADPLTGEGIYYAFRSAELAAEAVAAFLREGRPLAVYSDRVQHEIHADLRHARRLAGAVYRFPQLSYRLFFRNRLLCGWALEILSGELTYRRLLRRGLRHLLTLPFQTVRGRHAEVALER